MTVKLQLPPVGIPVLAPDGSMTDVWRKFFNDLVTRTGGVTGGLQPADATLDALAALNNVAGLVVETSADTFTKRSLAGTSGQITVANPTGSGGNPTLALANIAGVSGVHASPSSITVDGQGRITAIS